MDAIHVCELDGFVVIISTPFVYFVYLRSLNMHMTSFHCDIMRWVDRVHRAALRK